MLVLSRRKGESLSFPEAGITIRFNRVHSGTARIGIEAPRNVSIVRDESLPEQAVLAEWARSQLSMLPREVRHAIRNELHAIGVGLHLYKEQLALEMHEDAEETLKSIQDSLSMIDQHEILAKPAAAQVGDAESILIVEDNDNEREMLASFLRLKGYSVACATDGDNALEYLATHDTPLSILLDMKMPNRDGISTLQEIRVDDRHRAVNVIAISASTPEENGLQPHSNEVNRWFTKPLQVETLLGALHQSDKPRILPMNNVSPAPR